MRPKPTDRRMFALLLAQGFLRYPTKAGTEGTVLEPELATEVPTSADGGISADGLTHTFHLCKGVKFQPPVSREVTAQDSEYGFERMMSEPRAPATSFYMGVVGADQFMAGKAKRLLTEAGYPDGFMTMLHTDNADSDGGVIQERGRLLPAPDVPDRSWQLLDAVSRPTQAEGTRKETGR